MTVKCHFKFRMGRRYRGIHQAEMAGQIELSRQYIENEIRRDFPNHNDWFHITHRGIQYNFYIANIENVPVPVHLDIDASVRILGDELLAIENEGQDALLQFFISDGDTAARIQIFNVEWELVSMPRTRRIYKHWLFYGNRHPQFAVVYVILL